MDLPSFFTSSFKTMVLIVCIFGGWYAIKRVRHAHSSSSPSYKIGILQTASHPALDAAREGFQEEMQKNSQLPVIFEMRNAQGSVITAQTVAKRFQSDRSMHAFFAIATPALQALSSVEKQRPIAFAAVSDANALGLLHPTSNVFGMSDMIDVEALIQAMMSLVPNAQRIGIIFNPAELNSITIVQKMEQILSKNKLEYVSIGVHSEADIPIALGSALRKVDALLAPTDNMVASAIILIANQCRIAKKPLIVSDNLLVAQGALMARGVDYKASGQRAAQLLYSVLVQEKTPAQIGSQTSQENTVYINQVICKELGIAIPVHLNNDKVVLVY